MPGQTPEAAFSDFAKPVRAALRCLDSAAELHDRRFHESSTYLLKTAADGLSFGPRGDEYVLHVSLRLALVKGGPGRRRYRMSTRRYAHEIWRAGSSERLMGWHWHPDSKTSPFRYPHIHVPPVAAMRRGQRLAPSSARDWPA